MNLLLSNSSFLQTLKGSAWLLIKSNEWLWSFLSLQTLADHLQMSSPPRWAALPFEGTNVAKRHTLCVLLNNGKQPNCLTIGGGIGVHLGGVPGPLAIATLFWLGWGDRLTRRAQEGTCQSEGYTVCAYLKISGSPEISALCVLYRMCSILSKKRKANVTWLMEKSCHTMSRGMEKDRNCIFLV